MNVEEIRSQLPLLARNIYLDSAGAGAPPISVHKVMLEFLEEWKNYGENWESWLLEIVKAREAFGQIIGCDRDHVGCIPNVTSGLAAVAVSLKGRGKNVVVSELNFPTSVYVWHALKQSGFIADVRVLKSHKGAIPMSEFERAIDANTVAVCVDFVSWLNGCRENIVDVTRLAHSHGALMLVDAFHALGVFPVDVKKLDVDVLTCGTYKWLMGPHGAAFIYVKQNVIENLNPSIVGWHGISDSVIARTAAKEGIFARPFDLSRVEPANNATRFEWGTWSVISVIGSRAALEFTLKYDPKDRWPMIRRLTDRLLEGLQRSSRIIVSPIEDERRSGIVTFQMERATEVARKLQQRGVVVAPRVNTLRVSPHFYNTEHEIDVLLDRIKDS
jgi:cysteine desulfurase/selenocysteine lyase